MKPKPFSREQIYEFNSMTADLSLPAKGAWMAIRMRLCELKTHLLETSLEQLARILRCESETLTTVMKEFERSLSCGLRVEWPPGYGEITEQLLVIYEPSLKAATLSFSESLRVQNAVEYKKNKEKFRMPENWNLSEKMQAFGEQYGMFTETLRHEFTACKLYHQESEFTASGWEVRVWQTWVLNWVKFGRKQITSPVVPKAFCPAPSTAVHGDPCPKEAADILSRITKKSILQ